MNRRRAILLGAIGIPFTLQTALAGKNTNTALLLARIGLNRTTIPFDGAFAVTCSLEAREKFCRIYAPLAWGYTRGFRLYVNDSGGKTLEPKFHPPGEVPPPDMFRGTAHYRELDVGESVSFRSRLQAKDVFPAPGRYRLGALYVPEPSRKFVTVSDVIVEENGPVTAGPIRVKVV